MTQNYKLLVGTAILIMSAPGADRPSKAVHSDSLRVGEDSVLHTDAGSCTFSILGLSDKRRFLGPSAL